MHKSISNILSRRNMIKGSAAAVASSVAVSAFADIQEDDSELFEAIKERKRLLGKVIVLETKCSKIHDTLPPNYITRGGKYLWNEDDIRCCVGRIIYRIDGKKTEEVVAESMAELRKTKTEYEKKYWHSGYGEAEARRNEVEDQENKTMFFIRDYPVKTKSGLIAKFDDLEAAGIPLDKRNDILIADAMRLI